MRNNYLGLFFTSLAPLMMEILLTSVFSFATWYTSRSSPFRSPCSALPWGALAVYLKKDLFPDEKLSQRLALFSILFGISVVIALMIFLSIPFYPRFTGTGIFSTVFVYLVISMPFMFAGVINMPLPHAL